MLQTLFPSLAETHGRSVLQLSCFCLTFSESQYSTVFFRVADVTLRRMVFGAITARYFRIAAVVHLSGMPRYSVSTNYAAVFVTFKARLSRNSYVIAGEIYTLVRRIAAWMDTQRYVRIPTKEFAGLRCFFVSLVRITMHGDTYASTPEQIL
jgi:hypothetical protein